MLDPESRALIDFARPDIVRSAKSKASEVVSWSEAERQTRAASFQFSKFFSHNAEMVCGIRRGAGHRSLDRDRGDLRHDFIAAGKQDVIGVAKKTVRASGRPCHDA